MSRATRPSDGAETKSEVGPQGRRHLGRARLWPSRFAPSRAKRRESRQEPTEASVRSTREKGGGQSRAQAAKPRGRGLKGGPNRGAIGGKLPQKMRQHFLCVMAEREGFEPSIRISTYTRFPSVLLQPLGHLSA